MRQEGDEVVEYDISGQICPSCLLMTLKEVNARSRELRAGAVRLHVLTDSRQATNTIPGAVRNMGLAVAVQKRDGRYTIVIGKNEADTGGD